MEAQRQAVHVLEGVERQLAHGMQGDLGEHALAHLHEQRHGDARRAVEQDGEHRRADQPGKRLRHRHACRPPPATSASVAHLKVNGMATVTSLAASISTSESDDGRLQIRPIGRPYIRSKPPESTHLLRRGLEACTAKPENTLPPAARRGRCMAVALTPADAVVDVHLHRPQISEPGQAVWR